MKLVFLFKDFTLDCTLMMFRCDSSAVTHSISRVSVRNYAYYLTSNTFVR